MNEQENEPATPAVQPYFVESFVFILRHLGQEKTFKHLFNDSDEAFISAFKNLTEDSQKVYLTLFRRSKGFFRQSKLRIDPAPGNLAAALLELSNQGFLSSDLSAFPDDELLNILDRKEVNDLATAFKLPLKGSKSDLICSLLKISREKSILSFF
ncbi:unnamed protein product, partial [Dibothriocephalus latus]